MLWQRTLVHEMVVIKTDRGAANLGTDGEADERDFERRERRDSNPATSGVTIAGRRGKAAVVCVPAPAFPEQPTFLVPHFVPE